jgi:hypothetical protein
MSLEVRRREEKEVQDFNFKDYGATRCSFIVSMKRDTGIGRESFQLMHCDR